MRMKDIGWVWEGQGLDPGVFPSIYGVGEGCAYFGLKRACYIFHPNDEQAMRKLRHLDEVICDISKWKWQRTKDGGSKNFIDAAPATVRAEAENVGRLSLKFPNITGAFHDDMKGLVKRERYTPAQYGEIYAALKRANPKLKLWTVVYTHELEHPDWKEFAPFIDVVNLWVWNAKDIPKLDGDLDRCRAVFPGKPVVMGCYLRDYPSVAPVPMDMLKLQWHKLVNHLQDGKVTGFSILGAVLIDGQQEQANWVRDFIADHS
ncbi:MAG: hypothetical protein HZA91_09255 [Verrucomicrobia bacterium]|nr:hypothetical protein [Verrucomicrobiota bacterium]